MMNELEVFTAAASSDTFVYLSLICVLAFAAGVVWLVGRGHRTPSFTCPSSASWPLRPAWFGWSDGRPRSKCCKHRSFAAHC